MGEDDLKNLKELNSKNKPRVLTMYFEDGGEISVVPYDDYYDLQQEIQQLKLEKAAIMNAYLASRRNIKTRKRRYKTKVKEIRDELRQRDEVIEKVYKFVNHYRYYLKIKDNDYLKDREEYGELDNWQVDELLEILNKYKGDSNEL